MRSFISAFLILCALPASAADEDDWGAPPPAPPASERASGPVRREVPSETARRIQLLKVRANGLYRARKYRDAAELYAACARLDPGDASVRNDLAGCYQKVGRKDSAVAFAREALRL